MHEISGDAGGNTEVELSREETAGEDAQRKRQWKHCRADVSTALWLTTFAFLSPGSFSHHAQEIRQKKRLHVSSLRRCPVLESYADIWLICAEWR